MRLKFPKRWYGWAAVAAVPLLLAAGSGYIVQSGNVSNGHLGSWAGSGVLQDAGTSDTGAVTTLGITANGGTPFCISTAKNPNPRIKFCLGVLLNGSAYMEEDAYNGAATVPFNLIINGTSYPFPSSNPGANNFRAISSGSTDTLTTFDGTVAWDSSAGSIKTENLYACSSGAKANKLTILDEIGTAGTYLILIVPSGTDKVNNQTIGAISFNNQSLTIQCDGAGNWVIQ